MLIIPGFTPDDKVPGVVARSEYGAGRLSIGAIPLTCVLFGNMGENGTAELNKRYPVTTEEDADTLFEPQSELAGMCHAALGVTGVTLEAVAVAEATGAAAATLTITISGNWSTSGELPWQLDEVKSRSNVPASATPATFGDILAADINQAASGRLFCVADNTVGTVTLTVFSKGVRGNYHALFLDKSKLPGGMNVTVAQHTNVSKTENGPAVTPSGVPSVSGTYILTTTTGGANGVAQFSLTRDGVPIATNITVPVGTPGVYSVPGDSGLSLNFEDGTYVLGEVYTWISTAALPNGGMSFSGGTGTDDIQDALDGTESETNDYIAIAHNDATNVAAVEVACNNKAAFDVGKLENYVVALNRGQSAAIAIGQTTMNDQLGTCVWAQNHPMPPSKLAAIAAAQFSVTEGADPNHNYDDEVLQNAAPHFAKGDNPNRATLKTALNNSLTPLVTVDGKLTFVRAICSRSLSGTTPDYRTYDRGDVAVAIRVRKEMVALGLQLKVENPYVGPDIAEDLPPAGTLTPSLFDAKANSLMQTWEGPEFNWLEQVSDNPVSSQWDPTAKRIMSIVPTIAKTQNHQIGIIVRQQAA